MKQKGWVKISARNLRLSSMVFFWVLGIVGVFFCGVVDAQERLPGVVEKPPVEVPSEVKQPAEVEPKKEPELEKLEAPAELVATLKAVKFSGDIILNESVLQGVAAPYLNRPLKREDLARLKYDLTKLYYDKGYVLVKVTTPPQDLSEGVLGVVVYTGRIGEMEIDSKGLNPRIAGAMTRGIHKGEVFHEGTVESAVKDVDDIENIRAKLNLRPGKEFGTTDLLLTVEPVAEDVQNFMVDNYGSELTGKVVAALDLKKSNLFSLGESIRLNLRKSAEGDDEEELKSVFIEYKMPLGWRNLKLELNYLYSENEIGDRLVALNATGETKRFGAGLSGRLINTQQRQMGWRAGIETRTHESFLFDSPESKDDISQVYLEGSYLYRTPKYVFYSSMLLTKGVGIFGADRQGESDASRSSGNPRAWRLQPILYANFHLTDNGYLQTVFTGQLASDVLLASDLFVLGGYGSVRGMQVAQEAGEGGFQFSTEYSHKFVSTKTLEIKAGPFLDGGAVSNRVLDSSVDSELYSIGIGVEAKANLFKFGETKLRLDWGHPIGSYDSTIMDNDTFYFRLAQSF